MSKDFPTIPLDPANLPGYLKDAFANILLHDRKIDALKVQYIEPVADQRAEVWKDLKSRTDIARVDLNLFYKLYRREQEAEAMKDAEAGAKVLADIRLIYTALRNGETLNFLDVLAATGETRTVEMRAQPPMRNSTSTAKQGAEVIALPQASAGCVAAFNRGQLKGAAGEDAAANPFDGRSAEGKAWRKGWDMGVADRQTVWLAATDEGAAARRDGREVTENPHDSAADPLRWKGWGDGWETEGERVSALQQAGDVVSLPLDGIDIHHDPE